MKPVYKVVALALVVLSTALVILIQDDQEVFIESEESKTITGNPVFNKIKWIKREDKDIWMMKQSHHGTHTKNGEWDRLAIVIDKTKSPMTARFYQLESGPLEWMGDPREIPFRVSCYMCHSNGPRAIRPNYDSPFNETSLWGKLKIAYWNI